MEERLMDKEVLCLLDTRQIQRFIFRGNTYIDTLGGSDLIVHVPDDAVRYALQHTDPPLSEDEYDLSMDPDAPIPYFTSKKIQFQMILCAAGNTLCIVRTGALCRQIIRKVSRYYLDHSYSLNLASAVTEKTDNLGEDVFRLYRNLYANKASCEISDPFGALPVTVRENNSGENAIGRDPKNGGYYSVSSAIRRQEALRRDCIVEMKDMNASVGGDGKKYLAVIHADGNNLGISIGRILQNTRGYEEGIRARRKINRNITTVIRKTLDRTLSHLREAYADRWTDERDFQHSFYIVLQGGDDINCICSADLAMPFLKLFFQNLRGSFLWESEEMKFPLYACAGVAFVTPETGFHRAFHLAEECCESAKTTAKLECNLRDGFAGSWIDYQIGEQGNIQELPMWRQHSYITNEGVNLLLRPYCVDPEADGQPYSFDALLARTEALRKASLSEEQKRMLLQSYVMGRMEHRQWVASCRRGGLDLVRMLGQPLYEDEEGRLHAVWFDAAQLLTCI